MVVVYLIVAGILVFCLLYAVVTSAVSKGIDESKAIKALRKDIVELEKLLETKIRSNEERKHIINKRV